MNKAGRLPFSSADKLQGTESDEKTTLNDTGAVEEWQAVTRGDRPSWNWMGVRQLGNDQGERH